MKSEKSHVCFAVNSRFFRTLRRRQASHVLRAGLVDIVMAGLEQVKTVISGQSSSMNDVVSRCAALVYIKLPSLSLELRFSGVFTETQAGSWVRPYPAKQGASSRTSAPDWKFPSDSQVLFKLQLLSAMHDYWSNSLPRSPPRSRSRGNSLHIHEYLHMRAS